MKKILFITLFFLASSPGFAQDTSAHYPYHSEDIIFENSKAGITLAGTLTIPATSGEFSAVVLISGNGEHDRNGEFSGHKPFLTLADYLTKNGIAVLRFDKRGVGSSTGNFKTATTFDFSDDVSSAVEYLLKRKEINKKKIGLIGHSEGGLIAPIVAGKSKDIAFIVLLAAPGIPGDQLLLQQQTMIAKAKGVDESNIQKAKELNQKAFEIVKKYTNAELRTQMTNYITKISKGDPDKPGNMTEEEYINLQVNKILSPWMVNFLRYDPSIVLKKIKRPVLILNGTKDLQVSPIENAEAIKKGLVNSGNKKVTAIQLPNLNHLFQECETGLPNEYNKIEQSFSPIALKEILQWLKKQVEWTSWP